MVEVKINKNGIVSNEYTSMYEEIARQKLGDFHDFIKDASVGRLDRVDWWVSGFTSRNCFNSSLYFSLCSVLLAKRLICQGDNLLISTDSFSLYVIFKRLCREYSSCVRVRYRGNVLLLMGRYLKSVMVVVAVPLVYFGFWFFGKRKPDLPDREITLLSSYATKEWWSDELDRYFPSLFVWLNEEEKRAVYFYPRLYGVKLKDIYRINYFFRTGFRKTLLREDFLGLRDYIFAWSYFWRMIGCGVPRTSWLGVDVGLIYVKEIFSYNSLYGSMNALLNYRFIFRLKEKGILISRFINFFENQISDKAMHIGFRECYPGKTQVGYEGYSPVTPYYCSYPTRLEWDNNVLPDVLALPGKGHLALVTQYASGFPVVVAPHFRGRNIYNFLLKKTEIDGFKVIIALPHVKDDLIFFVDLLDRIINELSGRVQVIIKPHPIVSVKYVYDLFGEFVGEDDVSLFDGDLYDVLSTSNLLISNASGTLIDSIAMGIPAVLFSIPGKFLHNPIPEEFPSELWELCRSSSMVVDYIKGLIDEADDGVDRREYLAKNIRSNYYEPVTREGVLGLLGFED